MNSRDIFSFSLKNRKGLKKLFQSLFWASPVIGSEKLSFVFMLDSTPLTFHKIFSRRLIFLGLLGFGLFLFLILWLFSTSVFMHLKKSALEEQNLMQQKRIAAYREELERHSLLFSGQEMHFAGTLRSWKESFQGNSPAIGGSSREEALKKDDLSQAFFASGTQVSEEAVAEAEKKALRAKQKRFESEKLLDILDSDFQSMQEGLDILRVLYQDISEDTIFHDSLPMRWPLNYGLGELIRKEKNVLHFSVLPGAAVVSPSDGVVIDSRRNPIRPHLWDLKIRHEFGFFTEYKNLAFVHVLEGDAVKAGTSIAESSDSLLYAVRIALQESDAERHTFMRY